MISGIARHNLTVVGVLHNLTIKLEEDNWRHDYGMKPIEDGNNNLTTKLFNKSLKLTSKETMV